MAQAKTNELTGAALDWAVAQCDEDSFLYENIHFGGKALGMIYDHPNGYSEKYSPSSNWLQGGPIIERERFEIHNAANNEWAAHAEFQVYGIGKTPTTSRHALLCCKQAWGCCGNSGRSMLSGREG